MTMTAWSWVGIVLTPCILQITLLKGADPIGFVDYHLIKYSSPAQIFLPVTWAFLCPSTGDCLKVSHRSLEFILAVTQGQMALHIQWVCELLFLTTWLRKRMKFAPVLGGQKLSIYVPYFSITIKIAPPLLSKCSGLKYKWHCLSIKKRHTFHRYFSSDKHHSMSILLVCAILRFKYLTCKPPQYFWTLPHIYPTSCFVLSNSSPPCLLASQFTVFFGPWTFTYPPFILLLSNASPSSLGQPLISVLG